LLKLQVFADTALKASVTAKHFDKGFRPHSFGPNQKNNKRFSYHKGLYGGTI